MTPDETEQQTGRLLAVGDIHGCLDPLVALMGRVKPTGADRVVFLGDYVDRGPDSAGVLDFLLHFADRFPQSIFLRGNHEQMFLDYLARQESLLFLVNGGQQTLNSYRDCGRWPVPPDHRAFLSSLPCSYESDQHIFVHAGLRPGVPLASQKASDMLWIRGTFLDSDYDWGKTVVYGHTPRPTPFLAPHRIGLDTGCVYGRRLTCCEVTTGTLWQV